MTGSGSPCGACKFLRRKCARGCVFAPYFCHEDGPAHFAAIHRVFGASNVAKLLAHLHFSERREAALTISYEAQARVQDPIYGCVSHIFALQQQVVNLQAQLASLKQQAAAQQTLMNGGGSSNPNERFNGKSPSLMSSSSSPYPQDVHTWLQSDYPSMLMPQFEANSLYIGGDSARFGTDNGYSSVKDEDGSFGSYDGSSSSMATSVLGNTNDLHSIAFGYNQQYS